MSSMIPCPGTAGQGANGRAGPGPGSASSGPAAPQTGTCCPDQDCTAPVGRAAGPGDLTVVRRAGTEVTRQRFAEALIRARMSRVVQNTELPISSPGDIPPRDSPRFRRRHPDRLWPDKITDEYIAEEVRQIRRVQERVRRRKSGGRRG